MEFSSRCSSPDPLALSYDENANSPSKFGRRLSAVPLATSSANALAPRTPTKSQRTPEITSTRSIRSIVMRTPGKDGGSPTKIRVTLEAEPDQQPIIKMRRSTRQNAQTRIVQIPLKGSDENGPVKRRGNRGLSTEALIELNRKDLTPMKGERSEETFRALLKDASLYNLGTDPYGGFGVPSPQRQLHSTVGSGSISQQLVKRSASKRRASVTELPGDVPLKKKPSLEGDKNLEMSMTRHYSPPMKKSGTRGEYLRQSLSSSPESKFGGDEGDETDWNDMSQIDCVVDSGTKWNSDLVNSDNHQDGFAVEDDTSVLDRSALESEGFSLVSIDSLRSKEAVTDITKQVESQQDKEYGKQQSYQTHATSQKRVAKSPEDMRNPHFRPPRRSLAPLNSPGKPTERLSISESLEQRTPPAMVPQPSPPPVVQNSPTRVSPTKVSPILRAGSALQSILNSPDEINKLGAAKRAPEKIETPVVEVNNVFEGFGDRTRKQLRAGMMMGELLARGERGFKSLIAAAEESAQLDTVTTESDPPGRASRYSRLPTPTDSEHSGGSMNGHKSEKPDREPFMARYRGIDTDLSNAWQQGTSPHPESSQILPVQHPPMLDEWQEERNAVIREAQEASPDRVIIIASDSGESGDSMMSGEGEEVAEEDIWQEEANRSLEEEKCLKAAEKAGKDSQSSTGISAYADLFEPEPLPTRGKIPSPWRKSSGKELIYSDEMDVDESYLASKIREDIKADLETSMSLGQDSNTDMDFEGEDEDSQIKMQKDLISLSKGRRRNFGNDHAVNISDIFRAAEPLQSSPSRRVPENSGNILTDAPLLSPSKCQTEPESSEGESFDDTTEATFLEVTGCQSTEVPDNDTFIPCLSRTDITPSDLDQLKRDLASMSTPSQKTLKLGRSYENASFVVRNDSSFYVPSSNHDATSSQQPKTHHAGLLGRLRSYFWSDTSISNATPADAAAAATTNTTTSTNPPAPTWGKPQYTLLNRIWRSSPLAPPPLAPLDLATSKPTTAFKPDLLVSAHTRAAKAAANPYPFPSPSACAPLRPAIAQLVGVAFSGRGYTIELREAHARLVQLFIDEAGGAGLESSKGICVLSKRPASAECGRAQVDGMEMELGLGLEEGWVREKWEGNGLERAVALRVFALIAGEEGRRADAGLVGTVLEMQA